MPSLTFLNQINLPQLGEDVVCEVYSSRRSRRATLSMHPEKGVRIVVPHFARNKEGLVKDLLENHSEWITAHWPKILEKQQTKIVTPTSLLVKGSTLKGEQINKYVKAILSARTRELANELGYKFGRISVRDKTSSWGSCSRRGTLSLNKKIFFLPDELRDYVLIHELVHLEHFDHSKRFWAKVGEFVPNYDKLRRKLRKYSCA